MTTFAEVERLAQWLSFKSNRLSFRKILVKTRADIGLPAERGSMDSLARRFGFDSVYQTNAKTGEGIQELRPAILSAVQWQREQEPAIETEVEFIVRNLANGLRNLASAGVGFLGGVNSACKRRWKGHPRPLYDCESTKVYYVEIKHWKKDKPGPGQISSFIEVSSHRRRLVPFISGIHRMGAFPYWRNHEEPCALGLEGQNRSPVSAIWTHAKGRVDA